jgi:hypothetical protein
MWNDLVFSRHVSLLGWPRDDPGSVLHGMEHHEGLGIAA